MSQRTTAAVLQYEMKVNITLLTMITWAARRKEPEGAGGTFEGVVMPERPAGAGARLPPGRTANARTAAGAAGPSRADGQPTGRPRPTREPSLGWRVHPVRKDGAFALSVGYRKPGAA